MDSLIVKGDYIETIKLFSLSGTLLLEKHYEGVNEINLNLSRLSSGFYFININRTVVKKLIIK